MGEGQDEGLRIWIKKNTSYGDELYDALRTRSVVDPLTEREPDITIEDAYHISLRMVNRRLDDGEKIVGKKIGVTSKAVQNMLNVHQPGLRLSH